MTYFKKWWFSRYSVIDVAFGVALSTVYMRFKILDYGIDFKLELPFSLNKLNLINLLTQSMLRRVAKMCGNPYSYVFWKLSKWKGLEVQVSPDYHVLAFWYHWSVHCDHWGHVSDIVVLGLNLCAKFYDGRHWDNDKDAPISDE